MKFRFILFITLLPIILHGQYWRQYYDVQNINTRFGVAIPSGQLILLRDSSAIYKITHLMSVTDSMATVFRLGYFEKLTVSTEFISTLSPKRADSNIVSPYSYSTPLAVWATGDSVRDHVDSNYVSAIKTVSNDDDFTIAFLPDAHFYARIRDSIIWWKDVNSVSRWIKSHKTTNNIVAVIQDGDISNNTHDWAGVKRGFDTIDASGLPYITVPGNHDYDLHDPSPPRPLTVWNSEWPVSRFSGKSWYGGEYNSSTANMYVKFDVGSRKFLVIGYELNPTDAIIAWMNGIITSNTDRQIIFITHDYLRPNATRSLHNTMYGMDSYGMTDGNDAQQVWDKCISLHPNVCMVVNGHQITTYQMWEVGTRHNASLTSIGINGNIVNQIYANYQAEYTAGEETTIVLIKFSPQNGIITTTPYATYTDTYDTAEFDTLPYSPPIFNVDLKTTRNLITNGDITATGSMTTTGSINTSRDLVASGNIYVRGNGRIDTNLIVNGKVGVGTTAPINDLEVNGTTKTTLLKVGSYNVSVTDNVSIPQSWSMTYPGAGIPLSTGSAWGSSITNNSAAWNLAQDSTKSNWMYVGGNTVQRGTGNVGIGTTNPTYALDLTGTLRVTGKSLFQDTVYAQNEDVSSAKNFISNTTNGIVQRQYGQPPKFAFRRFGGTYLSPSAIVAGNSLMTIQAGGCYNTSGNSNNSCANINAYASENYTSTSTKGAYLTFHTTASGGGSLTERVRIADNGNVGIGTTSPTTLLDINGSYATTGSGKKVIISQDSAIRLHGTSTVWDDLMFPFNDSQRQGGTCPTYVSDSGYYNFIVDTVALGGVCKMYMMVQIPHCAKEGQTGLHPHIHYKHTTTQGTPTFICRYRWFNIGGVPGAFTWIKLQTTTGTTNNTHQLVESATASIPGAGKTLSSLLQCEVYLESQTGTGGIDAYMFDIHYEIDALGSNSEISKN